MKIYYDATNNKEVIDVSGLKISSEIEALGLTSNKQMIEITDTDYCHEIVDGTLQSFNAKTRAEEAQTALEAEIAQERTDLKLAMGWTDEQLDAMLSLVKKS